MCVFYLSSSTASPYHDPYAAAAPAAAIGEWSIFKNTVAADLNALSTFLCSNPGYDPVAPYGRQTVDYQIQVCNFVNFLFCLSAWKKSEILAMIINFTRYLDTF